jgi:hypothetical protein
MNSIKTALLKIENVTEVEIDKRNRYHYCYFDTDRAFFVIHYPPWVIPQKDMTHFT